LLGGWVIASAVARHHGFTFNNRVGQDSGTIVEEASELGIALAQRRHFIEAKARLLRVGLANCTDIAVGSAVVGRRSGRDSNLARCGESPVGSPVAHFGGATVRSWSRKESERDEASTICTESNLTREIHGTPRSEAVALRAVILSSREGSIVARCSVSSDGVEATI
jgi:hypothetical protein